jgi:SAM-dependent methyltransferase
MKAHYDAAYFDWQRPIGEFGGWANLTKFSPYISESDEVLDFGCGGGYLLKNIRCRKRIGVELNPDARQTATANGVECFAKADEVPDGYASVIISNHALEHTFRPLDELRALHAKLRKGGTIVFVVPCESITYAFRPGDVNQHLYSWSPMAAGNLFAQAGFVVEESRPYIHKWPPNYLAIARLGRPVFDLCCRLYARWERTYFQVRVVAKKPA